MSDNQPSRSVSVTVAVVCPVMDYGNVQLSVTMNDEVSTTETHDDVAVQLTTLATEVIREHLTDVLAQRETAAMAKTGRSIPGNDKMKLFVTKVLPQARHDSPKHEPVPEPGKRQVKVKPAAKHHLNSKGVEMPEKVADRILEQQVYEEIDPHAPDNTRSADHDLDDIPF